MVTRLGPAEIQVKLDLAEARRQLDALRSELGRVAATTDDEGKKKQANDRDNQKRVERVTKAAAKVQQQAKGGRFGALGKAGLVTAGVVGAVKAAEFLLPPVVEGLAEGVEDIPLIGEDMAAQFRELERGLVDRINDLSSKLEAAIPSAQQTADIARARLLLGQQPGLDDTMSDLGVLYQVNEAQARAKRQQGVVVREHAGNMVGQLLKGGARK